MDFLPGADVSVRVMFEALGQPKVPDAGTVSWTLRGDAGTVLLADQPVTPAAGASYVVVTVLAAQNAITARYEKRTLLTKFRASGAWFTVTTRYLLVPFLNVEIGPENVRRFLGVSAKDLPDDEVDLTRAYLGIETTVTQAVLDAALAGTPVQRKAANDAILYSMVIESVPSLRLSLAQSETDGPLSFSRFRDGPNFDQLRNDAADLRSIALDILTGRAGTVHPIISATSPTDVITGA